MSLLRLLLLCLALCLTAAAPAGAQDGPATVIQDDALFLHGTEDEIRTGVAQSRDLGFDRVRITAGWSVIAPMADAAQRPEGDLTDPAAYPADNWRNLDRAVRLVTEGGLAPMIDIAFWAPRWATKDDASTQGRLRTEIDPAQLAEFSQAVARRYAGGYVPPAKSADQPAQQPNPDANFLDNLFGRRNAPPPPPAAPAPAEPLPAVNLFTIWNEPNHSGFVMPQWTKSDGAFVPRSPHIYRAMVAAAYPAIKAGAPGSTVLIGGTASMGSSTPGKSGVTPLLFLREMACVDAKLRPLKHGRCANFTRVPGDGWSHHPYSLWTTPDAMPKDRDKAPVANTPRLARLLRQLVAAGRIAPAVADIYMTEYGYETNPPDPQVPFSPAEQPRLLAWAEAIATRSPQVKMWPQFQLVDRPGDPAGPLMRPFGDWQTGLINADGTAKPAFAQYRTPAFARCVRSGKRRVVEVWGRLRGGRAVATVQARRAGTAAAASASGGWAAVPSAATPRRAVSRRAARAAQTGVAGLVTRYIPWRRGAQVRLQWTAPGAQDLTTLALDPIACGTSARKG
jgi:hypothetical protein